MGARTPNLRNALRNLHGALKEVLLVIVHNAVSLSGGVKTAFKASAQQPKQCYAYLECALLELMVSRFAFQAFS